MKVRAITVGLDISAAMILTDPSLAFVRHRLQYAKDILGKISVALERDGYAVQTTRVAFNSFEEWLLPLVPLIESTTSFIDLIKALDTMLEEVGIDFCSVGSARNPENYLHVTQILEHSNHISASIAIDTEVTGIEGVAPDVSKCLAAANICREVALRCGDLGNFRFCVGFNCPANTPFFPIACHASGRPPTITIGLENGDLIFIACFAANSMLEARDNLVTTLRQTLLPIQRTVQRICEENNVIYGGIDASINPGLTPPDSIAGGLEHLLQLIHGSSTLPSTAVGFGDMGTLSAVSAVTSALKVLDAESQALSEAATSSTSGEEVVRTAGYSGLMLPVMEDLTLAARASESPPRYLLRDLLAFSAICGVGLDTVPVPGDVTTHQIAAVYMEVGTLGYRLRKPLSCRLLPMQGLQPGDLTQVESPYLSNTRVFAV